MHYTVNALHATELYTLKWIVSPYVGFTLIKKQEQSCPGSSLARKEKLGLWEAVRVEPPCREWQRTTMGRPVWAHPLLQQDQMGTVAGEKGPTGAVPPPPHTALSESEEAAAAAHLHHK